MKCSEAWLREWVNPTQDTNALSQLLTMSGFEVEEIKPVNVGLENIVIGQVQSIKKHPTVENLQICTVTIGSDELLQIVCGAKNIQNNMKVAVAKIKAKITQNKEITSTTIHGVLSHGMLCSAEELGLAESSEGLFELPDDAPLGMDLISYLNLNDHILDISITPNRGDCLSIRGLAREIAILTKTALHQPKIDSLREKEILRCAQDDDTFKVTVEKPADCPVYIGRVIKNINAHAVTPIWMRERLRRSGIRMIHPVVDITNYVMLELGQPMHAFDLATLQKQIIVRYSQKGERIVLLDGSEHTLNDHTLLIADSKKPLALAGVMGGLHSGVTSLTKDIFLESAYFDPKAVAQSRQKYGLTSDSAFRFERGVDASIQQEAMDRATKLILDIAGGNPGPLTIFKHEKNLPQHAIIKLSVKQVHDVLGIAIEQSEIAEFLNRLGVDHQFNQREFTIHVPSYRYDLQLAEDIIEEIARLYGYDQIPTHSLKGILQPVRDIKNRAQDLHLARLLFSDLGYHEVISYSFISQSLQQLLDPNVIPCELVNPISSDMNVMRTNLWGGLLNTFIYNHSRQQERIRLFEIGTCFLLQDGKLAQPNRLAGLISGFCQPEQWSLKSRPVDFFDVKGDVEVFLSSISKENQFTFKQQTHGALHPGQSAAIYEHDQHIGWIGSLHPQVLKALDIAREVFVFELNLSSLVKTNKNNVQEISKFPEIRRDLALLVKHTIPVSQIQDTIKLIVGDWLKGLFIFDVYEGKGVPEGFKSIALAIIVQHATRTLVDEEMTALINRLLQTLKMEFGVELRS